MKRFITCLMFTLLCFVSTPGWADTKEGDLPHKFGTCIVEDYNSIGNTVENQYIVSGYELPVPNLATCQKLLVIEDENIISLLPQSKIDNIYRISNGYTGDIDKPPHSRENGYLC